MLCNIGIIKYLSYILIIVGDAGDAAFFYKPRSADAPVLQRISAIRPTCDCVHWIICGKYTDALNSQYFQVRCDDLTLVGFGCGKLQSSAYDSGCSHTAIPAML